MQAALNDYVILNPFTKQKGPDEFYSEAFRINEKDYRRLEGRKGAYGLETICDVYQYQPTDHLPLKKGWASQGSNAMVIYDITESPTGITVIIGETQLRLDENFVLNGEDRSSFEKTYVLTNSKRHEAYLLKMLPEDLAGLSKVWPWPRLNWINQVKRLDFSGVDEQENLSRLNKEWLQDAQLICLDAVKVKNVRAQLTYEGFYFPEQGMPYGKNIKDQSK